MTQSLKGYLQETINFTETFASVTRHDTIKLFLVLAGQLRWKVHHYDVKSAFLNKAIL